MSTSEKRREQTKNLAVGAILTAFVIVLQFLALFTRFGTFSITLVLIPIVLGAALCGVKTATWLGFVFGVVVLLSGDASWFLGFSVSGTVITVLAKGTACGLVTGLVYKAISPKNNRLAIWISAIICPIVNTGVFALGCYIFFFKDLTDFIAAQSLNFANTTAYIFLGLIGINFIIELLINIVLNPAITTVIKNLKKQK